MENLALIGFALIIVCILVIGVYLSRKPDKAAADKAAADKAAADKTAKFTQPPVIPLISGRERFSSMARESGDQSFAELKGPLDKVDIHRRALTKSSVLDGIASGQIESDTFISSGRAHYETRERLDGTNGPVTDVSDHLTKQADAATTAAIELNRAADIAKKNVEVLVATAANAPASQTQDINARIQAFSQSAETAMVTATAATAIAQTANALADKAYQNALSTAQAQADAQAQFALLSKSDVDLQQSINNYNQQWRTASDANKIIIGDILTQLTSQQAKLQSVQTQLAAQAEKRATRLACMKRIDDTALLKLATYNETDLGDPADEYIADQRAVENLTSTRSGPPNDYTTAGLTGLGSVRPDPRFDPGNKKIVRDSVQTHVGHAGGDYYNAFIPDTFIAPSTFRSNYNHAAGCAPWQECSQSMMKNTW